MSSSNKPQAQVEALLRNGLAAMAIELTDERISLLALYAVELHKWNKRMNLVARNTTIDESVEKHFLDSLTLLPIIRQQGHKEMSLLDVGTGAGFPGLVLKAACPQLAVTLVEPREKRVIFLQHIIRTLGLTAVEVLNKRIEDQTIAVPPSGYGCITSRALADPNTFLPMIKRFVGESTIIITMLGGTSAPVPLSTESAAHFRILQDHPFTLPTSGDKRLLRLLVAG